MPVKIPPNIGMSGKRKGSAVPVTPNKDNPSEENTEPKNSIIHRNAVEANPERKPIKAASTSILWSCIKYALIFSWIIFNFDSTEFLEDANKGFYYKESGFW